jgi:hypothetical protein
MTRQSAERIFAVVTLLALLGLLPGLLALPRESATFPIAIIAVMAAMAAIMLLRSFRAAGDSSPFFKSPRRFLLGAVLIVAYTALLPRLGFFTTTAILGAAFPALFGYRDWRVIVPAVLIFLGLLWVIFVRVFQRPLPTEFFLG